MRQLYLDAGAVDVAVETGDQALLDAVIRRWTDMVATRAYVTGGLGSRHRDEAFGDPFELPPDRAYAETCAAIASVMLGWRLLLATGEARFADQIERTAFNGVLSGLSLDGTHFFYMNPLQRRSRRSATTHGDGAAAAVVPVCLLPAQPDALHRVLGAVPRDGGRRTASSSTSTPRPRSRRRSPAARSGWRSRPATRGTGRVAVRVLETPGAPWTLAMRVPPGAGVATVAVNGEAVPAGERVIDRPACLGGRATWSSWTSSCPRP